MIHRIDKYTISVDGFLVRADAGTETRIRGMNDDARARFLVVMGHRSASAGGGARRSELTPERRERLLARGHTERGRRAEECVLDLQPYAPVADSDDDKADHDHDDAATDAATDQADQRKDAEDDQ